MNSKLSLLKTKPAFTIMEMIVTMIISSIVISMAIGMYLNFQKTFNDYISISDQYNDALTFISWFKTDIEKGESIVADNNEIIIKKQDKTTVIYQLNESNIIRESPVKKDTFFIPVTDYSGSTINEKTDLINKINLSLKIDDFETAFSAKKEYSNAVLFEIDKE